MRKLIITTLKSLAQLFQIPSESSGGCYVALDVNVKVYRLILKNCLYSTESDSGGSNQTNLRRNTPLRKRPTGLESACAPADIVPLTAGLFQEFLFCLYSTYFCALGSTSLPCLLATLRWCWRYRENSVQWQLTKGFHCHCTKNRIFTIPLAPAKRSKQAWQTC